MPKFSAEPEDALRVAETLHERGFVHLRARRRADLVTIESGPDGDPHAHARLRRVAVHLWRLEMATHSGRWEVTPFRALLGELLQILAEAFPWTLQPLE
jgi:hypothetical protein